jgi:hypothetical protein
MSTTRCPLRCGWMIALLVLPVVLALPAAAGAAVETFHRFEAVATPNYTLDEQCPPPTARPHRHG